MGGKVEFRNKSVDRIDILDNIWLVFIDPWVRRLRRILRRYEPRREGLLAWIKGLSVRRFTTSLGRSKEFVDVDFRSAVFEDAHRQAVVEFYQHVDISSGTGFASRH